VAEYKVTLKATTIDGCKDELSKTLVVKNNFNLFIPNSFTPNSDGKNDVFIPIFSNFGVDTKQYDLEIFDRWGSSIFRSTDIYKGWDGTNKNSDEPIKEGLYIYKIKYKALDGIFYNTMGHLTLLK
jgi:gliding motility-associated-like protein